MTRLEIKAIKQLTIRHAKETFKQDYGSYGEEDDDYIKEKNKIRLLLRRCRRCD